jgi:hypothetical protein
VRAQLELENLEVFDPAASGFNLQQTQQPRITHVAENNEVVSNPIEPNDAALDYQRAMKNSQADDRRSEPERKIIT